MEGVPFRSGTGGEVLPGFPTVLEEANPPGNIVHTSELQLRLDRTRGKILLEPRSSEDCPRDRMEAPLDAVLRALGRGERAECREPIGIDNWSESDERPNWTFDFLLFVDRDADQIGVKDSPEDPHHYRLPLSHVEQFLRAEGVL